MTIYDEGKLKDLEVVSKVAFFEWKGLRISRRVFYTSDGVQYVKLGRDFVRVK